MDCNTATSRLIQGNEVREHERAKEALMALVAIIALLLLGWATVAAAMLWGVLRISRRHQPPALPAQTADSEPSQATTATVH